jgi:hypothetical protein
MAKKTRVSVKEYKNLRDALYNANYKSSGVLARLLLEAFLFEGGDINAEWFVREKACLKGAFTKLRDRLVDDNWLHFREDTKCYFPGFRLRTHLDTLKAAKAVTFADLESKADRKELASLDARKVDRVEFAKVADDVQDLKAQVHQINALLAELKRLQAPPPNAAAQIRSGEIAEELDVLMKKTGIKQN